MKTDADLVILNGQVMTFNQAQPQAQAVAIKANQIIAVGTNEQINELTGKQTITIDAAHATVMPGFIESHMHLFSGSVDMESLDLFGITGIDNVKHAVNEFAQNKSSDELLFAVQADYKMFHPDGGTSRHDMDKVIEDRPFAMISSDYHTVWANTLALEKAGILAGKEVATGSEIVMAADGKAQGELREFDAYTPIMTMKKTQGREAVGYLANGAATTGISSEQMGIDKDVLAKGLQFCSRCGITTIHNMDGNFYQLELLDQLNQSGQLTCRTQIPFYIDNEATVADVQRAVQMHEQYHSPMLYSGRVKFFMDGVIESGTAFMLAPYSNNSENLGSAIFSDEQFKELAIEIDKQGLQMCVHAIGDAAVRRTLDGYQAARQINGVRDSRHRIEHIEVIDTDDIPRLAELGVVASMQPLHAAGGGKFDADWIIEAIGDQRILNSYPTQTLRESGAKMIFSSDWPVVQLEPMDSVKSAMMRQRVHHEQSDQRQSLHDSLAAYTCDGAYVDFAEHSKGKLMPGMLADIVVLSDDLDRVEPDRIDKVQPVVTICDGHITYDGR